jgi:hypothetical protein
MSKKYANVVDFSYDDQCLSRIDFDTARQIYENGLVQLLQISGLSMCHRVFKSVLDGINVFEPLDSGSSKIKRLDLRYCQEGTLFQFLAQSNQSKHVKMLFLKETEVGTPNSLRSLTSLIKLNLNLVFIDDRQAEIDFTSYLNAFPPSLQYFSAKCPSILFNEFTVSTNITVLHILCCEIDKECGDILSNCFPKLKY